MTFVLQYQAQNMKNYISYLLNLMETVLRLSCHKFSLKVKLSMDVRQGQNLSDRPPNVWRENAITTSTKNPCTLTNIPDGSVLLPQAERRISNITINVFDGLFPFRRQKSLNTVSGFWGKIEVLSRMHDHSQNPITQRVISCPFTSSAEHSQYKSKSCYLAGTPEN